MENQTEPRQFVFQAKVLSIKYKKPQPYVRVYELLNKNIKHIGDKNYNPASTRGEDSEALNLLVEKGIVSSDFADTYYTNSFRTANVRIRELY